MRTIACDRCGAFIKQNAMSLDDDHSADMVIFAKRDCLPVTHTGVHLDLCGECKKSFVEWLGKDIPDDHVSIKGKVPTPRPKRKPVTKERCK